MKTTNRCKTFSFCNHYLLFTSKTNCLWRLNLTLTPFKREFCQKIYCTKATDFESQSMFFKLRQLYNKKQHARSNRRVCQSAAYVQENQKSITYPVPVVADVSAFVYKTKRNESLQDSKGGTIRTINHRQRSIHTATAALAINF